MAATSKDGLVALSTLRFVFSSYPPALKVSRGLQIAFVLIAKQILRNQQGLQCIQTIRKEYYAPV